MEILIKRRDNFSSLPGYIFLSLLLGGIGVFTARAAWQANTPGIAILGAVLIIIHISLYWLNFRQISNPRWWVFYYIAQTLLILALAFLPSGANILGTMIIAIIVEALGVWGNTRRAFAIGLFYTTLMTGLVLVLLESEALDLH